ncbi:MAG: aldehyde dehydrogenase [Flavobacteriaceae bacterium]|nr:aldehyde dehydrogenase [Flavobacteriaceae bacterium]NNL34042.1 aldehyde dehydrogenase [Flavobacteriaceae bacterium]
MSNIPKIIKKQRKYFNSHATRDVDFLRGRLNALRSELILQEQAIYEALENDFNKPPFETYLSEFGIVMSEIDLFLKKIKSWTKPKRVLPALLSFPTSDFIYKDPYGTVLIIAPWNYPFQLAIAPLIAAIAAGNTVVLKPSELTPNTSQLVHDMVSKIFAPEHAMVIQGGIPIATELLSQRWDYIFFTGSVPVGKIVAKAAAEHLTPVTLELGGKSPCIVDDTVPINLVAKRLVWGKFLNAGQTCIAPDYLIVHSKIKYDLIEALKKRIISVYGANPESSPDLAHIVNSKNLDRLKHYLEGETILHGGGSNAQSNFLEPTLIDEPELDSAVMSDEIFGPILPILAYDDIEDIKVIVNQYEKPLSFYIFSNNKSFRKQLLKFFSFGGGVINDTLIHFGNKKLPFGGVGHSGMGAYHGKHGFDTFIHKKGIVKKGNWLDIPIRYAPYKGKMPLLKRLFKLLS